MFESRSQRIAVIYGNLPTNESLRRQADARHTACVSAYHCGRISLADYDLAYRDIDAWSGAAYDEAVALLDNLPD